LAVGRRRTAIQKRLDNKTIQDELEKLKAKAK